MLEFNYFNNDEEEDKEESYPDFFLLWNETVDSGKSPGYVDADDLCEIIDIYLSEDELDKAKFAIDYLQKLYPDNEEVLHEVLLILNEYGLWDDLLVLCEKYKNLGQLWHEGHKIAALLHLGMEEDAFHFFRKMKQKYANDKDSLLVIYQAMTEVLYEVDLYDAGIDVIEEAFPLFGKNVDLLWTQLQCFLSKVDKENVIRIAGAIQQANPLDAESWSRLGEIYRNIEDIEKSIEAFEFAQSLGLNDPNNLINMINAYEKNGNYNKALEKANEYLDLHPKHYLVNLMTANLYTLIDDWVNAIKHIDNALLLSPQTESLYLYKSSFLMKLGEFLKAKKILEEGILKTKDTRGTLHKELENLRTQFPEE